MASSRYAMLSNENIDIRIKEAEQFLSEANVDGKDILRIRLAMEETLLNYKNMWGETESFSLRCVKRLGRLRIELSVPGIRYDPFAGEEEGSEILRSILAGMGIAPVWQYKNGSNQIIFTPRRRKPSQVLLLTAAVVLAAVCGGLCALLPECVRSFLSVQLVAPIFNMFMGLLTAIAGPMIFLSVVWGVYSIGDTATLSKVGKRMILRFLLMSLLLTILAGVAMLPFFPLSGSGGSSFDFSQLLQMVLDVVPGNFFTPFTEANPLQIIFVAVVIGLAMLVLGAKGATVASFVEQSNSVIQLIMEAVSGLIPFFVFGSIFNMILSGSISTLLQSSKLLPIMLLGHVLVCVVYLLLVCVRKRVSLSVFAKKVAPTFLIGLSTASSAAAYSTNVECCEKQLGIDRQIINFGIPLGQVVFMPGAAVIFLAAGLCMAEVYGVPISPAWLISALLITVVLAVAAPPVPGGGLTCYTMLFLQLNIPAEAVAITIALNVILEFFGTAVNLFCLQAELVELAGSLDRLDVEMLRRK